MATVRDVIYNALYMSKVVAVGRTVSAKEAALGLQALQSLYDLWISSGMFGELADVYLTTDETAEEGNRYFVPTGKTLTAPTSIYASVDGDTRQPRDLAVYESLTQAGARVVKIYDRTEWVAMTGLGLDDTAPLSGRGAFGLSAVLATCGAFMAAFGAAADLTADIHRLGRSFLSGLMMKRGSTRDRLVSEYF